MISYRPAGEEVSNDHQLCKRLDPLKKSAKKLLPHFNNSYQQSSMSCRDEFLTDENSVGGDRVLRSIRLSCIAKVWKGRCTDKYNKSVAEYNRRMDAHNEEMDRRHEFYHKYAGPWSDEVYSLKLELRVLVQKWKSDRTVTADDWDAVTLGRERKAIHAVHYSLPKNEWPILVRDRFPNLIALLEHEQEEQIQEHHETLLQIHYKAQYREIVKHFAIKGTVAMKLERLSGDTSDELGWQIPTIAERIAEQIDQMREELKADKSRFEKSVDNMLFNRIRYNDAMKQDFDAHTWVRMVFENCNLSTANQPVERAASKVREWVAYWKSNPEGNAEVYGALRTTLGFSQTHSDYSPYDREQLNDEREPAFDIDITQPSDID